MDLTEHRRPSGFARWGWTGVAVNVILVVANAICLAWFNGGPLNWGAIVVCTASGVFCHFTWRHGVRSDRQHRARMAEFDRRIAQFRGSL